MANNTFLAEADSFARAAHEALYAATGDSDDVSDALEVMQEDDVTNVQCVVIQAIEALDSACHACIQNEVFLMKANVAEENAATSDEKKEAKKLVMLAKTMNHRAKSLFNSDMRMCRDMMEYEIRVVHNYDALVSTSECGEC